MIPDYIHSAFKGKIIDIRNPNSVRPYQDVLEELYGYLLLVKKQTKSKKFQGSHNFESNEESSIATIDLVDIFCNK
jgi:CDP-glucose 4,6-dehydratase